MMKKINKKKLLIIVVLIGITIFSLVLVENNRKHNILTNKIVDTLHITDNDTKKEIKKVVNKNYDVLTDRKQVVKYISKNFNKINELYPNITPENLMEIYSMYINQINIKKEDDAKPANPKLHVDEDKLPVATIDIDGIDEMKFKLFPNEAPESVYNFIDLANSGFYDNLKIHRLVKDFVAQGGDPKGDGTGGPDYAIKGEFSSNGVLNEHKNKKGSLSWARSGDKDSAGSQFYINLNDNTSLDGDYAAFGQIISGEKGLEQLNNLKVDAKTEKPSKELVIKKITVDTKGIKYPEPEKLKN